MANSWNRDTNAVNAPSQSYSQPFISGSDYIPFTTQTPNAQQTNPTNYGQNMYSNATGSFRQSSSDQSHNNQDTGGQSGYDQGPFIRQFHSTQNNFGQGGNIHQQQSAGFGQYASQTAHHSQSGYEQNRNNEYSNHPTSYENLNYAQFQAAQSIDSTKRDDNDSAVQHFSNPDNSFSNSGGVNRGCNINPGPGGYGNRCARGKNRVRKSKKKGGDRSAFSFGDDCDTEKTDIRRGSYLGRNTGSSSLTHELGDSYRDNSGNGKRKRYFDDEGSSVKQGRYGQYEYGRGGGRIGRGRGFVKVEFDEMELADNENSHNRSYNLGSLGSQQGGYGLSDYSHELQQQNAQGFGRSTMGLGQSQTGQDSGEYSGKFGQSRMETRGDTGDSGSLLHQREQQNAQGFGRSTMGLGQPQTGQDSGEYSGSFGQSRMETHGDTGDSVSLLQQQEQQNAQGFSRSTMGLSQPQTGQDSGEYSGSFGQSRLETRGDTGDFGNLLQQRENVDVTKLSVNEKHSLIEALYLQNLVIIAQLQGHMTDADLNPSTQPNVSPAINFNQPNQFGQTTDRFNATAENTQAVTLSARSCLVNAIPTESMYPQNRFSHSFRKGYNFDDSSREERSYSSVSNTDRPGPHIQKLKKKKVPTATLR